jgi:hypothetical protein
MRTVRLRTKIAIHTIVLWRLIASLLATNSIYLQFEGCSWQVKIDFDDQRQARRAYARLLRALNKYKLQAD